MHQKWKPSQAWACARGSDNKIKVNRNKHITKVLEEMKTAYESSRADTWKARSYGIAITRLSNLDYRIENREQAIKLDGIGKNLADHIAEIIETGRMEKLDNFSEENKVIGRFCNIHGVSAVTAGVWYRIGNRSLEDLKKNIHLNHSQQVGVKYYDDFLKKIPREEVFEIGEIVRIATQKYNPNLWVEVCGSYRRGLKECGDVDIMITNPDQETG
eukprot:Pgem_evm1s3121